MSIFRVPPGRGRAKWMDDDEERIQDFIIMNRQTEQAESFLQHTHTRFCPTDQPTRPPFLYPSRPLCSFRSEFRAIAVKLCVSCSYRPLFAINSGWYSLCSASSLLEGIEWEISIQSTSPTQLHNYSPVSSPRTTEINNRGSHPMTLESRRGVLKW